MWSRGRCACWVSAIINDRSFIVLAIVQILQPSFSLPRSYTGKFIKTFTNTTSVESSLEAAAEEITVNENKLREIMKWMLAEEFFQHFWESENNKSYIMIICNIALFMVNRNDDYAEA